MTKPARVVRGIRTTLCLPRPPRDLLPTRKINSGHRLTPAGKLRRETTPSSPDIAPAGLPLGRYPFHSRRPFPNWSGR